MQVELQILLKFFCLKALRKILFTITIVNSNTVWACSSVD